MSVEQPASTAPDPVDVSELRAEVERLRSELDRIQQARAAGDAPSMSGQPAAQLVQSTMVVGAYNSTDAPTTLECTQPTSTLSLINASQGTPSTGTPVGLYALAQGIGMIVSAYGVPPAPVTSKAVQAFCQHGEAIFAQSINGSAVFANTTNGTAAIVADQGSANPRAIALVALGGSGIGAYASGATAALQLGRSSSAGPPISGPHEAGELVLDANADLYLCKQSGTPGTWNRIG